MEDIQHMLQQLKTTVRKIAPSFLLDWYHLGLAFAGAVYYGFPSRKLKVIGITGTNGKSTTVELICAILKENGSRVAAASSIRFEVAGNTRPNLLKMTMPGRFAIQKILAEAVKEKCDYAIIEVTSEGIKQHRHRFIDFYAAIFTNLTPEHIEAHGGFENYRKAKECLFAITKSIHIINADDENAGHFLNYPAKTKICCGLDKGHKGTDGCRRVVATDIKITETASSFNVNGTGFNLALLGEFNVCNALAAIGLALALGIDLKACQRALAGVKEVPGRMERVIDEPKVFVDYAFTPNALEKVYNTLSNNFKTPGAKMVCVLGACGGGRDKWKRPVLGGIAAKYCDRIILTNEDPYDEDPEAIVAQVKKGAVEKKYPGESLDVIMDRREAIGKSLSYAKKQDIVILTGKGSEPWICLEHGKKIPWNEKETAIEELAKLDR